MARVRKRSRPNKPISLSNDTEIRALQIHLQSFIDIDTELKKKLAQNKLVVDGIRKQIHDLQAPSTPKVSEHGFLRYLERVEQIDLKAIENKILTPEILEMMKVLGKSGSYPLNENFKIVVKENTVVSVVPIKSDL